MENLKTIGIIGYGHLGKALSERIRQTLHDQLLVSSGKEQNAEIARNADLLILTVPPAQIAQVMKEIHEAIKKDAVVVSFAAATPAQHIGNGIQNQVVRVMTDINFRQMIAQKNTATDRLLSAIGRNPLLSAELEKDIDAFTVLIGCFPGICAWQFAHNPDAEQWLKNYAIFVQNQIGVPVKVSHEIIDEVREKGNFELVIATVATKGGVTERLIKEISANGDIAFPDLFEAGMKQIAEIAQNFEAPRQNRGV